MRPLAIIGGAYNFLGAPKIVIGGKDVWGFNFGAKNYPVTTCFQMHAYPYIMNRREEYYTWLKNLKIPVYMRERHDEFPTSVAYPFDDVFKLTEHALQGMPDLKPIRLFTSTPAYAIALAILQGYLEIDLYGIELADKTEHEQQRDSYAFWVGFAAGRGISMKIHCGNGIFRKKLYGEDWQDMVKLFEKFNIPMEEK
jgi:hypothetical protein